MGQGVSPGFTHALSQAGRVSLDTNACIYFLSALEPYSSMVRAILDRAQNGKIEAQIGGIVLMELLVAPYRSRRKEEVDRIRIFVGGGAGVSVRSVSETVLFAAAEIRAITRLKAPDALVAASAAVYGCDVIVGNDGDFARLNSMPGVRLQSAEHAILPKYLHLADFVTTGEAEGK